MKILFIGSTKRGYAVLQALNNAEGSTICGIISLKQNPTEHSNFEAPIRKFANENDLPLFESNNITDEIRNAIANHLKPELMIVVGCRVMISKQVYGLAPLGAIAVHDSLLPEYRGFAPTNWAVINGEQQTGVSLFYLNEQMDGGDLLGQKKIDIDPDETATELYEKVIRATVDVIVENLAGIASGTIRTIKQDPGEGSYLCSRTPQDGLIDWTNSTRDIYNLVRGLSYPYPGAYTYLDNRKLIIWTAKPIEPPQRYKGRIPGRIVSIDKTDGSVDVLTGDGILRLFEVQSGDYYEPIKPIKIIKSIKIKLGLNWELLLSQLVQPNK